MAWKTPEQHRHDELVEVVGHASRLIASSIEKGFRHMADAQTAALADLATAVTGIADSISAEIGALQAAVTQAVQNAANMQPDDSAAIEAQVSKLNNLNAALKASVAPATPAPVTPAPSA